ncbi:MAG: anhydro-N-acetylmuramic acid kinase [Alphaproteobacteria bacterium]
MEVIRPMTALGMMSGTSIDGVDAALIITDGIDIYETGPAITRHYDEELKNKIRSILWLEGPENAEKIAEVEKDVTLFHAEVAKNLLENSCLEPVDIDVVGFHGHTILHNPSERKTHQIGNGKLLADELGIEVINRFRNVDVTCGGQGAPLVPVFHEAMTRNIERPVAVLNIGGVANFTWIGENGELLAFDTGPGNAMIDDWVNKTTDSAMDYDGNFAVKGNVEQKILNKMMSNEYFIKIPPKSLDRNEFMKYMQDLEGMSPEDGAATLTAFTAEAVAYAVQKHFPKPVKQIIVSGGGARNPTLMRMIRQRVPIDVVKASSLGWNGDAFEAQAFAFLAVRSVFGLPISFASTTGVPHATSGGTRHFPKNPSMAIK